MKVLHLNTYSMGGAAVASVRIHRALQQHGAESKWLALYRDKKTEGNDLEDFRDVLPVGAQWRLKIKNKLRTISQQRKLRKAGKQVELFSFNRTVWDITKHPYYQWADVIHMHWVSGFLNMAQLPELKKTVVFTQHDFFPFSGGYHYPVNNVLPALAVKQQTEIQEILTRKKLAVAFPSAYVKNETDKLNVFSSGHLRQVIHNPVSGEVFNMMDRKKAAADLGLHSDYRYLLFVSDRINYPRKGFAQIVKMIDAIPPGWKLLVAGGHPGNFLHVLQHPNVVWLHSITSEQQMNLLYNVAEALLVPSLNDNYPNTIIESLACGTPVIANSVGGIGEIIQEGVNGYFFTNEMSGNEGQPIIDKLSTLKSRSEIRNEILQTNNPAAIAQQYISLYKSAQAL